VLTKASSSARAKITSVLSQCARATTAASLVKMGPPVTAFPENSVPLAQILTVIRTQKRSKSITWMGKGDCPVEPSGPSSLAFRRGSELAVLPERERAHGRSRVERDAIYGIKPNSVPRTSGPTSQSLAARFGSGHGTRAVPATRRGNVASP